MRTNIEIDDELLDEARLLSDAKSKKEIVERALREYVKRLRVLELLKLRGKIAWTGNLEEMRTDRLVDGIG
jgi:Arc/MetJ family transcription regulator